MTVSYEQIIDCLRDVFPETNTMSFTPESTLGDLPEWDSMAAVNLQTALERQFGNDVPLELLSDETALGELVAFLNTVIGKEAVC
jgi:acyl carrier protein